jgi:N-acetylglutamate synthase-like GNAT family acetyltransferase
MTTSEATEKKPLWLLIEEKILAADSQDLSGGNLEASIKRIAGELDDSGYNVSRYGGNLLKLRWAIDDMAKVGNPLLKDVNGAIAALTLEDAADAYAATTKILGDLGDTWPKLKSAECRTDVIHMVEQARLGLLIAKAKELSGDEGIRYLITEKVADEVIVPALELADGKLAEVHAAIAAEKAERDRVAGLLAKVADKSKEEKVKHLFDNNVAEELIMEMAQVDQGVLDTVKKAMEEELKEKQRLAEEEAARKKAEAEGPSLDAIPADEMIDYIDSIREIMEFSDVEKEIRTMCEQSSIPKALVDIAVSDPDKLDELEKQAEG